MQGTVDHPPAEAAAFALPVPRDELIASLAADLAAARATAAGLLERLRWYQAAVDDPGPVPARILRVVPDVTR